MTFDDLAITWKEQTDRALSPEFDARLEYTAVADSRFLNHFFRNEPIEGFADVTGKVAFSRESFSTSGAVATSHIRVSGWTATALKARFSYNNTDARFIVSQLGAETAGGFVEGSLTAGDGRSLSRVTVDLRYRNIDMAAMRVSALAW